MLPLFVVDAFTDEAFRGNPAAVCVLGEHVAPDGWWMHAVAAEMRHSETAFVSAEGGEWQLRWFTPTVEVDLCGHGTLATAHVLWTEGFTPADAALRFRTRSGVLVARRVDDMVQLDFPALFSEPVDAPEGLAAALGTDVVSVARNAHDLLVELRNAVAVRALEPDLSAVAAIDARAVVVTAASDELDADFVSRTFGPRVGIPEDPVTGSAHCALAPYWAPRIGRAELVGRQLSARGGVVRCTLADDRVLLAGRAVTVLRGTLLA